ncbi:MAG: hypothetical protein EHM56_14880, partial [Chloroflexi bacterium]
MRPARHSRHRALVTLAACILLLAAACGPSPSPGPQPAGPAATVTVPIAMPVVISLAGFFDDQTLAVLYEQIAAFEAA